ncbi:hypothetical protein ACPPVO_37045 [Dactylosporangium sp. McL0621]|uniref:hypothetical protein n=1 Tax=Dactylosporangium sp. McL0621 TaxID=3415678 RepID=UPI003CF60A31
MTVPAALSPTSAPPARKRRWGSRRARLVGGLAGILATVLIAGLVLWVSHVLGGGPERTASNVPVSWQRPIVNADGLVQRSGVKITQVAVTGDGGLVDLRFKVVDPERANTMHDPTTPPAVVDEESGLVVHQLFMDHSHTGPYKTGVTYYLVFNNPGNWVHHGSRVSVMLGNAQVEHVLVP